jgi:hypothetical protein
MPATAMARTTNSPRHLIAVTIANWINGMKMMKTELRKAARMPFFEERLKWRKLRIHSLELQNKELRTLCAHAAEALEILQPYSAIRQEAIKNSRLIQELRKAAE